MPSKKLVSVALSSIVIVIIGLSVWFVSKHIKHAVHSATTTNNTAPTNTAGSLSSTSLLEQYHEPHVTPAQSTQIITDLHNVSNYSATTEYNMVGNCGSSANADLFRNINVTRTLQLINGVFPILRTPNPKGWTMLQANIFMNDPTVACGVGFFYPFEVEPQFILWRRTCSTGALPTDSNNSLPSTFVQCIQAQEVISKYYHLVD